jgi:LacI family transcriptional regulator
VKRGSITIEDVAAAAGVSRQTVSRVINQQTNVSSGARSRVEQAIATLGYVPSLAARRMGGGRSGVLLAVAQHPADGTVPDLPIGRMLVAGIAACNAQGYRLMVELLPPMLSAAERVHALNAAISAVQPDGVVLLPPLDTAASLRSALAARAIAGEGLTGLSVPPTGQSNPGEAAAHHLLALGHRQIGFVADPYNPDGSAQWLAGYRRALAQRGSAAHRHFVAENLPDSAAVSDLARSWLVPTIRPTAIITETADLAVVVLRVARSLKLAVPRDLSLVALADHPVLARSQPPIAALHPPDAALFAAACSRLIAAVVPAGAAAGDSPAPGPELPPPLDLLSRASIGPAPTARRIG